MTIRHQYFCSQWYTSAQAMTPLHGCAASGLKGLTHPHYSNNLVSLLMVSSSLNYLFHLLQSIFPLNEPLICNLLNMACIQLKHH